MRLPNFLLYQKSLVLIGERVQKNGIALKDIIQFSEFDEENFPKFEEEKIALLTTINKIKDLSNNEEKFIKAIEANWILKLKKKKCLIRSRKIKKQLLRNYFYQIFQ